MSKTMSKTTKRTIQGARREGDLPRRIMETIYRSGRLELRQLTVRNVDGCMILEGEVPTYHAKQVAQVLAGRVQGVDSLRNAIRVNGNSARVHMS